MATALSSLETQARDHLNESSAAFWSSAELIRHANNGIKDLWKSITDLYEDHYITVDESNVSLEAGATTLTGVPSDVYRITIIEPRDTTATGTGRHVLLLPRPYHGPDFTNARAMATQDPSNGLAVYYDVHGAGAPVGAPTIRVAPRISSDLNLRVAYVPTIPTKTSSDDNPVPGESDQALIAWIVAYARAKEREDRSPDPNWLAVYATEKQNCLTSLQPRQTQEPVVVEGMFDAFF